MLSIHIAPLHIKISGHASFAAPGKDIVCAGVSALAMTLYLELKEKLEAGWLDAATLQCDSGNAHLYAQPQEPYALAIRALFEAFSNGLCAMAQAYPEYIKVKSLEILK